jgi:serine/threonine-protein kinase
MLRESEKRAAKLAVSRYGADAARVQQVYKTVFQAHAQGKPVDLLETLVRQRLLTPAQASELRHSLDLTHLDPNSPAARGNGHAAAARADGKAAGPSILDPDEPLQTLGKFRLLRRLGEGGMGAVYLGYAEDENRPVAIKVLADHLADNQASVDRFYREARSGALLNHPNIVRNLLVGQDHATGKHYFVMEYVDGPSALQLLQRYQRLAVGDAVHIILDIARGLEHAHSRNVVHRDIKPDNILMTLSGVAKLADMGLAKRTDEASHLTHARQGFGTPYYMPYEQAMNAKYADGRSDIYALGATLYHLITGEVPFPGDNHIEIVSKKDLGFYVPASALVKTVPVVLDDILERMLARDPPGRYQTVSELIVDLDRANLSAAVPSFVDEDLALRDPLVRQRLTAPAQPTSPDLQMPANAARPERDGENPDIWYVRYRDRQGHWCKARATTRQVLQRLGDGVLSTEAQASHQPQGDFRALRGYDEFRLAVAKARRLKMRRGKQVAGGKDGRTAWRWWLLLGVSAGLVVIALVVVLLILTGLW